MVEHFLKNYSIVIQEKVYEENNSSGQIIIYRTTPFGLTLTLNDQVILTESDCFILHEMMVHPAIYSHPRPRHLAIVGNHYGILHEILKHPTIKQIDCIQPHSPLEAAIARFFPPLGERMGDTRIKEYNDWQSFVQQLTEKIDIIFFTEQDHNLLNVIPTLGEDGILVHQALPSFVHLNTLKVLYAKLKALGFKTCQGLNFPQPSASHGWRTIIMATKREGFKRVREIDVFNRPFTTRFYNYDMHKAATVLPEFMREELGIL